MIIRGSKCPVRIKPHIVYAPSEYCPTTQLSQRQAEIGFKVQQALSCFMGVERNKKNMQQLVPPRLSSLYVHETLLVRTIFLQPRT